VSASNIQLDIEGIGVLPISLDDSLPASTVLKSMAAKHHEGRVHRAEPLPPPGSSGPPYALVQFALEGELKAELHAAPREGSTRIRRGHLCLIPKTSDLFVSLAPGEEHDSWSDKMTVVGTIAEPELTTLVEGAILSLPRHDFTHPQYKTLMSMLDSELRCHVKLAARQRDPDAPRVFSQRDPQPEL
jgi:hypothetical protein